MTSCVCPFRPSISIGTEYRNPYRPVRTSLTSASTTPVTICSRRYAQLSLSIPRADRKTRALCRPCSCPARARSRGASRGQRPRDGLPGASPYRPIIAPAEDGTSVVGLHHGPRAHRLPRPVEIRCDVHSHPETTRGAIDGRTLLFPRRRPRRLRHWGNFLPAQAPVLQSLLHRVEDRALLVTKRRPRSRRRHAMQATWRSG